MGRLRGFLPPSPDTQEPYEHIHSPLGLALFPEAFEPVLDVLAGVQELALPRPAEPAATLPEQHTGTLSLVHEARRDRR